MKLTIVPVDNIVIKDGVCMGLTSLPDTVPDAVHALQWDGSAGIIENTDGTDTEISSLPSWASDCVTAHDAAVADEAANAPAPPTAAELARSKRDSLLAETDWWAVADRTMTQAEIDYRQALRDVPAQAGFPDSIAWPTKP